MERLENQLDFFPTDQLRCQVLKSDLLFRVGQFQKARSLAEKVFQESQRLTEPLLAIDALFVQLKIDLTFLRIYETSGLLTRIEKLLSFFPETETADLKQRKATLMWGKARSHLLQAEHDQALEYAQIGLALREELGNNTAIADSFKLVGDIFNSRGDLNRAMEYYQRALTLREEIGNRQDIAHSLNDVGLKHYLNGNFEQASACFEQSLATHKEIGNKFAISNVFFNLGWMTRYQGDLLQALDYFNQALANAEDIGFPTSSILFQIGLIYGLQGELDQALEYMERSLPDIRKLDGKFYSFAWSLNRLAKLYREKGDFDQATKHLSESLALSEELGTDFVFLLVKSETLFYFFSIALDQNFHEQAREYLLRLQAIVGQVASFPEKNELILQRYRVAKALMLKTSPRITDKASAQELLQQVINDELVDHDLVVLALLILCDSLLVELRMSGESEVLDEVKTLTMRLLTIAKQQPSYWLLAETYVLQSRLALFDLDLEKAQQFLDQSLLLAEEKGLKKLAVKIYSEQSRLRDQLDQWERLVEQEAPLNERLELAQLESLILRMAHRRLEITEEETLAYAHRAQQLAKAWGDK
ncbi:MAG: tetratricopeptide repeat protein [Candidatus Hodarchaeales archaeon]